MNGILEAHRDAVQKADVVIRIKKAMARAARDPKLAAKLKRANEALIELRTLTPGKVYTDPTLANLSIQYRNEEFIGEKLLPTIQVAKPSGVYFKYEKRDRLATPDDSVATRATPNEVSEHRTPATYNTDGKALIEFLDQKVIEAQDAPLNEMVDLIASLNDHHALGHERRAATVLTTAANFPGQTRNLTGNDRWDVAEATSTANPLKDIQDARDAIWSPAMGATKIVGYCGLAAYRALRRHHRILKEFKHVSGLKLPTRQQLAEFFELDDLLVGASWTDTANEGQTASYGRLWGPHFGIIRVASSPSIRTAAFGWTFRFGQKATSTWYDPKPGVSGGYWGKVGAQYGLEIAAPDTGYLLTNVIG